MKIDIYWDLRATDPERHTGVGKHVIEVIKGLRASGQIDLRVLLAKDQLELWTQQAPAYDWLAIPTVQLPHTNKGYRFRVGAGIPSLLDRICAGRDLVYSPMELLLQLKDIPFINTIHGIPCFEKDIPQVVYQSWGFRKERMKQAWFFLRCRQLCRTCFVVSDYLKERLTAQFGFGSKQLHTVFNGAEDIFYTGSSDEAHGQPHAESIRLLQIGGANLFDGAPSVLQVARYLEKASPNAKIAIVGDRHEAPWEHDLRAQANVEWCGFLSGSRLLEEMKRATALLYVPAVESFGIIGVEAMATGLPILATQSTALPEVLGDAACWIDPADDASIQRGIERVCQNEKPRAQLIDAGLRRANRYRWSHVVERVVEGFKRTLSD